MSVNGTVSSYNPHKGWGFIECNGQGVFVNKRELKGFCLEKGTNVQFTIANGEKGPQATEVRVLTSGEEATYTGEIKTFNPAKGYGFIGCEAFPDRDVFVLRSDVPGGFAPQGGHCKFKVKMEEKGPQATDFMLLGAAGNQYQQMKQMMGYGGKGFGKFGPKGKGKGGPRVAPENKVWIGNLAEGTSWKDLQAHMDQAGKTKWVEAFEGKGAGTGTAAYATTEEVAKAIEMLNGSSLAGSTIAVDAWVKAPKEEASA